MNNHQSGLYDFDQLGAVSRLTASPHGMLLPPPPSEASWKRSATRPGSSRRADFGEDGPLQSPRAIDKWMDRSIDISYISPCLYCTKATYLVQIDPGERYIDR